MGGPKLTEVREVWSGSSAGPEAAAERRGEALSTERVRTAT